MANGSGDELREVKQAVACLAAIRRRGSTTAAIAGVNACNAVLVVHDIGMRNIAQDMGAKRVQTISALRYGNPSDGAPIVVDHHAVVVLAQRAINCADVARARESEERQRADIAERELAEARDQATRERLAIEDLVSAARKVVEAEKTATAYQSGAIQALAAELAKLDGVSR